MKTAAPPAAGKAAGKGLRPMAARRPPLWRLQRRVVILPMRCVARYFYDMCKNQIDD
ncbi:hypothetical protein NK214_21175 [Chromobacterium sp. S0633]|nr:hypothetical protein [Chromobacterium sp. S0633]